MKFNLGDTVRIINPDELRNAGILCEEAIEELIGNVFTLKDNDEFNDLDQGMLHQPSGYYIPIKSMELVNGN